MGSSNCVSFCLQFLQKRIWTDLIVGLTKLQTVITYSVQYSVCLLCVYIMFILYTYTHTRSYTHSGSLTGSLHSHCFVGFRSRSAQKVSLLVPKRSTKCCSAARAQRLEGWKAKLYMAHHGTSETVQHLPSKVQDQAKSGWIRLNFTKSNKSCEDFQLFQPDLDKWNAKLKVATWPCQVGHIGITTSLSSSAAFNLRHTSSSAKDGPVALSPWEFQVMF